MRRKVVFTPDIGSTEGTEDTEKIGSEAGRGLFSRAVVSWKVKAASTAGTADASRVPLRPRASDTALRLLGRWQEAVNNTSMPFGTPAYRTRTRCLARAFR